MGNHCTQLYVLTMIPIITIIILLIFFLKVYPRLCGEYITIIVSTLTCKGSPPHVRGISKWPAVLFSKNHFLTHLGEKLFLV